MGGGSRIGPRVGPQEWIHHPALRTRWPQYRARQHTAVAEGFSPPCVLYSAQVSSYSEIPPPRNQRLARELYATAGQPCFFTVRCTLGRKPFADNRLAEIAVVCL